MTSKPRKSGASSDNKATKRATQKAAKQAAKARAAGKVTSSGRAAKSAARNISGASKSASKTVARSAGRTASRTRDAITSDRRDLRPGRTKTVDLTLALTAERLTIGRGDLRVELPTEALKALRNYAAELQKGHKPRLVTVTENEATLSSQQAADLLNVSRPFVVKLARNGQLRHTMTGNRHRFALADILEYDMRARRERDEALRDIVPADGYDDSDF